MKRNEAGYTIVELLMVIAVLAILSLGAFSLFISLLHSAIIAKRQAVASTLATNQMEYLKSLPYDNLATTGGPIISTTTIPGTLSKKVDGITYTVKTRINYIDDAYDGCASYTPPELKLTYCRNYPPPTGAPNLDTGRADYKDVNVVVTDKSGLQLAALDTHIAALVAETASNTGALFVKVVDDSGNPLVGATVNVVNSTVSPAVNVSFDTDQNGIAIFYDLPPSTTGYKYQISASETGYSSLTTIAPSGSLQPTYSSQNLLSQSSSYVTLTLKQQGSNSLVIETTNTAGAPLPSAKVYIKGGYKKYTATTDTNYYDIVNPSDQRPTTGVDGFVTLTNLVPGGYFFCGDAGATSCSVGGTTYYLAAAVPYGGSSPFQSINVPTYDPDNPPGTTFTYNSASYLQKVRLMLTTNSSFPRVKSLSPYDASLASGTLSSFAFALTGTNLPCTSSAASCSTHISFTQGSNSYPASCTGSSAGVQLNCTVNLSGTTAGNTQLVVNVGSNTLTLPGAPLLGGIIVTP